MTVKRTLAVVGAVAVALATAGGVAYWRYLGRRGGGASFGVQICESDWDCPGSLHCKEMSFSGEDGIQHVRLCLVRGIAREGEPCRSNTRDFREACIDALRCNYGVCGRSCDPSAPDSCPAGTRCREGFEPPSCVPACRGPADCGGAECAWVDADFSICARPQGDRCDVHPCKPGMVCRSRFLPLPQTPAVETRCVLPCSKESPCPSGQFCDAGECAIPCHLMAQDCPPPMVCDHPLGQQQWRCWPEGHPVPTNEKRRTPKLPSLPIEHWGKGERKWYDGQDQ
jgi:hypothetical protein